ncbi:Bpu10I family restriction endonuclease [Helicobacter heilmannii]|uniref:Bpu10I family restriction endonuclease n=1 Tax=Helicobacter heilmannii TaxID=35817 RepID=UPI0018F82645|nr:Bpu10I family restriction endonuclease [Helicobacter heilmannii]
MKCNSASAHDIKRAVMGAKYYLLCDFLDMTPISTATTDIDEILITRKAKRISSNVRKKYNTYAGRQNGRTDYVKYLKSHLYSIDVFKRFIDHIISQIQDGDLNEENVLKSGYF